MKKTAMVLIVFALFFCGCTARRSEETSALREQTENSAERLAEEDFFLDEKEEEEREITEDRAEETDLFGEKKSNETDEREEGEQPSEIPVENPREILPEEPNEVSSAETPEEEEETPEGNAETQKEKAIYIRSKVNSLQVRTGAGTKYTSIGCLEQGDMVAYYGQNGEWYETRYKGKKAYVSAKEKYTELYETEKSDEAIERVISVGCELLGTKYVYGAVRLHDGAGKRNKSFDVRKFDCSSLMQYIFYYGADVLLQVNTRTQVFQGEEIAKEEIRRGDLLFFTNASRKNKTGVERIGHVGLYLGDGYILHTASDYAVIEKITPARQENFICAKRIIQNTKKGENA